MTASAWHLNRNKAELRRERFSAQLDLLHPAEGLCQLDDASLAGANLLGVEIPSCRSADDDQLVDKHVRGIDLVVGYRQTSTWPVQVDAMWRALSFSQANHVLSAVELVVSVWTESLESRPHLTVRTALPADEVLRLADARASRFAPLAAGREPVLGPAEGPGCLLFRRQVDPLSYAEIVHPANFYRDEISGGSAAEPRIQVRHRLFPQNLEKGVVLRARVCGFFCPREDAAAIVAGAYRAFAASAPPLAT
jgi:hypothetical protein